MSDRHICDCGQVYSSSAGVLACQSARHSAAAGNEVADAERFARDMGVNLHELTEAEQEEYDI